jgi:predicted RNA-binding Zn-ribbon protein involved in translation (DUF1610 family)
MHRPSPPESQPQTPSTAAPASAVLRPSPTIESHATTALYAEPLRKPPEPDKPLTHCPDCGHNIRTITTVTCPNCDVNIVSAVRRHQSNAVAKWQTVDQYRRALVPLLISYLVLAVVLLVMGDPATDTSMGDLRWFALRQAFFVPCAIALYWVLCAAWLGFEQPFAVSVMGLMTAIAVSDTVGFFMWWVPVIFAYQFVVAITLMMVATKRLELEYQQGMILGLILGAVRYALHVILADWVG